LTWALVGQLVSKRLKKQNMNGIEKLDFDNWFNDKVDLKFLEAIISMINK
jgi:hypothetical protein